MRVEHGFLVQIHFLSARLSRNCFVAANTEPIMAIIDRTIDSLTRNSPVTRDEKVIVCPGIVQALDHKVTVLPVLPNKIDSHFPPFSVQSAG